MFFYLLKNSTIIEPELDETTRNTQILIYGSVTYIILHATLFLGGEDALLNCLKPYFWLFVFLDVTILTMRSDIDISAILNRNIRQEGDLSNVNHSSSGQNRTSSNNESNNINNVFNSFLKNPDIDISKKYINKQQNSSLGNPQIKRKNLIKNVSFKEPITEEYASSSDSDIGTDIDIDSFKESLFN
jgi:hypothetical protein